MKKFWVFGLLAGLVLAACQSSAPLHQYTKGNLLATYNFSAAGSFEEGTYGAATLQVIDGVYEINVTQGDDVLWWGQWGDDYGDTIIDVDTEQLSDRPENAYGVMCRVSGGIGQPQPTDATLAAIMQNSTAAPTTNVQELATAVGASTAASTAAGTASVSASSTEGISPSSTLQSTAQSTAISVTAETTAELTSAATAAATSATAAATSPLQLPTPALSPTPQPTLIPANQGDGYLFLIQGSGSFAIMRSHGRNLTPLVDWKASNAIHQGPDQNHLQAICAGNYLAFYANNQFLGDATDSTYTTGQVGLAASAATRLGTQIAFDNLTISAAQSK